MVLFICWTCSDREQNVHEEHGRAPNTLLRRKAVISGVQFSMLRRALETHSHRNQCICSPSRTTVCNTDRDGRGGVGSLQTVQEHYSAYAKVDRRLQ